MTIPITDSEEGHQCLRCGDFIRESKWSPYSFDLLCASCRVRSGRRIPLSPRRRLRALKRLLAVSLLGSISLGWLASAPFVFLKSFALAGQIFLMTALAGLLLSLLYLIPFSILILFLIRRDRGDWQERRSFALARLRASKGFLDASRKLTGSDQCALCGAATPEELCEKCEAELERKLDRCAGSQASRERRLEPAAWRHNVLLFFAWGLAVQIILACIPLNLQQFLLDRPGFLIGLVVLIVHSGVFCFLRFGRLDRVEPRSMERGA